MCLYSVGSVREPRGAAFADSHLPGAKLRLALAPCPGNDLEPILEKQHAKRCDVIIHWRRHDG